MTCSNDERIVATQREELGRRDPSKRDGCIEADAAPSLCSYCAIRFGRLNRHNIHRSANELS
jgi:hypothetical protein